MRGQRKEGAPQLEAQQEQEEGDETRSEAEANEERERRDRRVKECANDKVERVPLPLISLIISICKSFCIDTEGKARDGRKKREEKMTDCRETGHITSSDELPPLDFHDSCFLALIS